MADQAVQSRQLTNEEFLQLTRPKSIPVVTGAAIVPGQSKSYRLPQTGLGNVLWVRLTGTVIVAGTVTSGNFQSYPNNWPFGFIKRVQLSSNNGLLLRDLSGWSWYKWVRNRYGIDPLSLNMGSFASAGNELIVGGNSTDRIVGGAAVVAKTYRIDMILPMPISYNRSGDIGMLVLQQNSVFYDLNLTYADVAGGISATGGTNDLFNALVGTGLSVTADLRATILLDWFEVVPNIGRLTSMFMSCRDQVNNPLNVGRNQIYLPKDDYFTTIIMQGFNAGAPLAAANMGNCALEHSGNVVVYSEGDDMNVGRDFWEHRLPPPDGCITFDLGLRRGTPDRRDTFDAFDNTLVTNALVRFDTPSTLVVSGYSAVHTIWETLRFFQQT